MKMKDYHVIAIIAVAFLATFPLGAHAIPITGESSAGSSYKGEITYNANGSYATLQVTLEVSGPATYLGGFAFSNESILKAAMASAGNFNLSGANGFFQVTAGGAALAALPPNQAQFVLTLGGYSLGSLTAESILANFVILFSNSSGQVIDKVPVAVPEPSTMLLLGFGLLAVGVSLRKRS
jgi:hypothetical protein